MKRHNAGSVRSTKSKRPWKVQNVEEFSIELDKALNELDINIDIHKLNLERAVTSGDIDNHAVFIHRESGRYEISIVVYKGRMNYFITK